MADLEEADGHEDEAVGADASRPDLIEFPLQQELLQDKDQLGEAGILPDEVLNQPGAGDARLHVETDVNFDLSQVIRQFHDGNLRG